MAPVALAVPERRHQQHEGPREAAPDERRDERRLAGGGPSFSARAVLRPGQAVVLLNICCRGALMESEARLRPGAHAELLLSGHGSRARVRGRLERCQVVRLDPMRYRGVIVFDDCLNLDVGAEGSE